MRLTVVVEDLWLQSGVVWHAIMAVTSFFAVPEFLLVSV